MKQIATKKRSFVKAVVWRIIASFTTLLLALLFTGSIPIAIGLGSFDILIKFILYYFHERTWDQISWGRKK
jgi:uncharacterized membrane protein